MSSPYSVTGTRRPYVVPPGDALSLRRMRRPYYVNGFEPSMLCQPTPLRLPLSSGAFPFTSDGSSWAHSDTGAGVSSESNVVASSSRATSTFSFALQPRYRFSLHEAEIVRQIEDAENPLDLGRDIHQGFRKLLWGGAPSSHRGQCWRLVLEVEPAQRARRAKALQRKRAEYHEYVSHYFDRGKPSTQRNPQESQILQQLAIDLPRHKLSVFHAARTVTRLERCIFLWSLRHPAVGFVQGIDDLMVQFFLVFLGECFEHAFRVWVQAQAASVAAGGGSGPTAAVARPLHLGGDAQQTAALGASSTAVSQTKTTNPKYLTWRTAFVHDDALLASVLEEIPDALLDAAEADTYWCGGRMLSWVQENFVLRQPGLDEMMTRFETLLGVLDPELYAHVAVVEEVALGRACFQWFHCLLSRELPTRFLQRLWDTYLSIGPEFKTFHVYVCAALVRDIRAALLGKSFDHIMMRLKNPLTPEFCATAPDDWMERLIASSYLATQQHPLDDVTRISGRGV